MCEDLKSIAQCLTRGKYEERQKLFGQLLSGGAGGGGRLREVVERYVTDWPTNLQATAAKVKLSVNRETSRRQKIEEDARDADRDKKVRTPVMCTPFQSISSEPPPPHRQVNDLPRNGSPTVVCTELLGLPPSYTGRSSILKTTNFRNGESRSPCTA